jgi:hypothetical protein
MPDLKTSPTEIPLKVIDLQGDGFHLLVDVSLCKKTFTLVLDTGASKTAFDQSLIQAEVEADLILSDKLSTGLGTNTMESFIMQVNDLHIGLLPIEPFEAAVLDLSAINVAYAELGQPKVLGVLGSDVLMKYRAIIDYGKGKLILNSIAL